jgi:hypothetical protein
VHLDEKLHDAVMVRRLVLPDAEHALNWLRLHLSHAAINGLRSCPISLLLFAIADLFSFAFSVRALTPT